MASHLLQRTVASWLEPGQAGFDLPDESSLVAFAKRLGETLRSSRPPVPAWLISLQGELGAGKSTLARALLHELGHQGAVPSPTYALVELYDIGNWGVAHLDLYRLSAPEELEAIGWPELLNERNLLLVEWPERAESALPPAALALELQYAGEGRSLRLID